MNNLRPNQAEITFLTLAYNQFYDIFDEIFDDLFWQKDSYYKFCKIKDGFVVYSELLKYEPIKSVLDWMKSGGRPPEEGEIGDELFRLIRNIVLHFPFFESWDEVWISKEIVNWSKEKQFINSFLEKNKGKDQVKYRFWEESIKQMTYLSINFPDKYDDNNKIFLKDIISEKDGVKFSYILMRNILNTQVEEINNK